MKILKLPNGHLSAEFTKTTWPQLIGKLRRYGELRETAVADVKLITIGDAKFVQTDEWDGTALVATNGAADRLLTRLTRRDSPVTAGKRIIRSTASASRPAATGRLRRALAQRDNCEV